MKLMMIEIPEELARNLERIAAAQQMSVEQLAVDRLRKSLNRTASTQALLQTLRSLPHPSPLAMDELDAAITAGRIPCADLPSHAR